MEITKEEMISNLDKEIDKLQNIICELTNMKRVFGRRYVDFTQLEKNLIKKSIKETIEEGKFLTASKYRKSLIVYYENDLTYFSKTINLPCVKLPLGDISVYQAKELLNDFNDDYCDLVFIGSDTNKLEFPKIDTDDNIFGIIINVEGLSNMSISTRCSEIYRLYEDKYQDYDFIVIPSQVEQSRVVKLTNTETEIELLF